MTATKPGTPIPVKEEPTGDNLGHAMREYLRIYVLWHGRAKAAERFGVSRHTLWHCLERGHNGRAVPTAVLNSVGSFREDRQVLHCHHRGAVMSLLRNVSVTLLRRACML